jgi:hypothetical protein
MHTVNNGKEVRCFMNPILRVGADGSVIDASKCSYILVLNSDGTVKEGVVKDSTFFEKTDYHKDTGKKLSDLKVPFMSEVYDIVKKAAMRCPETQYIGWDVAVTKDGPVLIEGNGCSGYIDSLQEISNLYYNRGMKKEILEMLDFATS